MLTALLLTATGTFAGAASAVPVEVQVFGDVTSGRDHYCSLGVGTPQGPACMPGFGMGATLAGTGTQVEMVFTYETGDAPADSDGRAPFAIHLGSFDWIDLVVRIFDSDSSVTLVQDTVVTDPDRQSGQINLSDQALSGIFMETTSIDDLSATDATEAQVNGNFNLDAPGLFSGTPLALSFDWLASVDTGSGGGMFRVEQCDQSIPDCDFMAEGFFQVTQVRARVVPEPGTALLLGLGLLALGAHQRRSR
ncbi:MAG: PEP-CTERM sorting domain-containing protein [Myxococcota bacterium]